MSTVDLAIASVPNEFDDMLGSEVERTASDHLVRLKRETLQKAMLICGGKIQERILTFAANVDAVQKASAELGIPSNDKSCSCMTINVFCSGHGDERDYTTSTKACKLDHAARPRI